MPIAFKIATRLSAVLLALSACLLCLWFVIGPLPRAAPGVRKKLASLSWTRTHWLPLSSSSPRHVAGTEQIAIFADFPFSFPGYSKGRNLMLFHLALVPIYGKELGPDDKPLYGLHDPTLECWAEIRVSWMVWCLVISSMLPFLALTRRSRNRRQRGFPMDR